VSDLYISATTKAQYSVYALCGIQVCDADGISDHAVLNDRMGNVQRVGKDMDGSSSGLI
jgi:hypothetical protein